MTISRAINILSLSHNKTSDNDNRMALRMAIEALEKEKPKKPVNECCPICKQPTDGFDAYCSNCGQRFYDSESEVE